MDETTTDTTNQQITPTPTAAAGEPTALEPAAGEPIEAEPVTASDVTPTTPDLSSNSRELANSSTDENISTQAPTPEPTPTPTLEPVAPPIQGVPLESSVSSEQEVAPSVAERIVERVIEKEVIKEVPVEKIVEKIVEVEKIVYRDREPAPQVYPPPTQEEIEAIKRDFLLEMSKQGTAKRDEIMALKTDLIMSLFDTKSSITHKDVMEDLDFPSTTATRLLTLLRHEGKITLHGTSPHTFTYTKN